MKLTKVLNLITLGCALTFAATGCHNKKPNGLTPLPNAARTHGPGEGGPLPSENPVPIPEPVKPGESGIALGAGHPGWAEDHDALKAETIYFDFDKSAIKNSEHAKLDSVASYLKSHPEAALKVEGNCDERGTEEYNRSLGERRALAAREYLVGQGVDPSRVDTISYGEDKPADTGHDEAAWSKNRRDEFVVLTAPK